MPNGIKHAAVPPPQFTGKAFLLEVREHSVYTPSQTGYPYLYCKIRQHGLKRHRVKQFQTPHHGQGVTSLSWAAVICISYRYHTVFCSMFFCVCWFLWYFDTHQEGHCYFMGSQGTRESTRFFKGFFKIAKKPPCHFITSAVCSWSDRATRLNTVSYLWIYTFILK